jgi:two-component system sensor histidine kinase DegS
MESGAGAGRTASFDALYEEAKAAVGYAANELRALTERARAAASLDEAANGLSRLEASVASLERLWLTLGADDGARVAAHGADLDTVVAAQEAERARIAREIHDGPAQSLSNAVFMVEIVERLLEQDVAGARRQLADLRSALQSDLVELRALITQLRPPLLEELGLLGALAAAAAELERDHEVDVDLRADPSHLTEREQTVALRVGQEALRNVRKHAGATRASLRTSEHGHKWTLEVHDDGEGFDVSARLRATAGRNFGLRFMRERAESVGGALSIESDATGTRVRLTITPSGERSSAW